MAKNWLPYLKNSFAIVRIGDWLVILGSLWGIIYLFQHLWIYEPATMVQLRLGNKVYGTYAINQAREITVAGKLGEALIHIDHGKARFVKAACKNQYCVHQGWLTHAGQAAICLPNQVSLELLGNKKTYDSLNY